MKVILNADIKTLGKKFLPDLHVFFCFHLNSRLRLTQLILIL